MHYRPTVLYHRSIPRLSEQLGASIDRGCDAYHGTEPIELFFRADDIGVASRLFHQLILLFQRHQMPLCLAVVPCWLTQKRFADIRNITGTDDALWCWHQHGRLHKNFEPTGKKQEFGPARKKAIVKGELLKGQERLRYIMGESLSPYFTPPWNRCSVETAEALGELGFAAISRSIGARPDLSHILPDFQVNVDLHTRKELTSEESLQNMLRELENSIASGRCGIMLHHQRMNNNAFLFLDLLMSHLARQQKIAPRRFEELV
ncbi:polysaccharide deacetylase family protein [Desulfopila aestuarii]|uniref:Polysaccharide deacetylase n=1 Tax=Desulfopila aestuarii DSM 18488 TaxID=1121416 RepID=A0A1M7YIQ0_9BACT|nr:hypothetical protein [Desulfopila aestuarii]SHO52482.1 hypothetical protein SAMN02745220_04587 [Desulfopila aestuarii DSM 18488]